MRREGKVVSWDDKKGYGFVTPIDGGSRVFIHVKAFINRNRRPSVNDVVTYDVAIDKQGRVRAVSATFVGDKVAQRTKRNSGVPAILFALLFLTVVCISVFATNLPLLILIIYLTVSAATFAVYAIDKSAAQSGRWRTSEGTLHLLALAGGWPGALVAQQTLRHKSKKLSFRVVFWVTVLLNCTAFVWFHTSGGRSNLEQLFVINYNSITMVSKNLKK